jgi:short-subunit dehydrogenase
MNIEQIDRLRNEFEDNIEKLYSDFREKTGISPSVIVYDMVETELINNEIKNFKKTYCKIDVNIPRRGEK